MSPERSQRWYAFLLPVMERGGPILTLVLLIALIGTLWWGLGVLRECVQHNRVLNEKILAQQERFYTDLRLTLAHCPPPR